MKGGAKTWYFADGYLPEKINNGQMEAYEALMLFNTNIKKVKVNLDVYFTDREPIKGIKISVDGERIKTLRLDNPDDLSGSVIPPVTQYSLRVRSSSPVVVQFGRLDTTQNAMAYYVGVGFCE